jgi:hypothetical protein
MGVIPRALRDCERTETLLARSSADGESLELELELLWGGREGAVMTTRKKPIA